MSVELRRVVDGTCTCGVPMTPEERLCCVDNFHHIECDWGRIEHTRAYPHRGLVGHLVLVSADGFHDLIKNGSNGRDAPAVASATLHCEDDDPTEDSIVRMFYHLDYGGKRWTWELFETHWADGKNRPKVYLGRWPD